MGIIKVLADAYNAATGTLEGGVADQFLEVIEPDDMGATTVFTSGVLVNRKDRRGGNRQATEGVISDGSIVHVFDNQFMMLVDGGKIVDYTAEPGYFQVKNAAAPSLFNGHLDETIEEAFNRIKFGGIPSARQQIFFINLQEIKGLRFGTRNPINYFDTFYNAELFLRAHGTFSIKITDPLRFYQEVVPRNARHLDIDAVNEQFLNEFLEALQSAINQMSADGVRISHVTAKSRELSQYMSVTLDESWRKMRGIEIQAVGIASVSYDDESQKLISLRNQGAMLSDPEVREGYVQGAIARGLEAAGSNPGGATTGFMGIGLGQQTGGTAAAVFSQSNQQSRMRPPSTAPATIEATAADWTCGNSHHNTTAAKFCTECGQPRPASGTCHQCGHTLPAGAKFCPNCGAAQSA